MPKKYILIADGGSTKTEWALINDTQQAPLTFFTTGFNPAVTTGSVIKSILNEELAPRIWGMEISEVWFYGAGCIGGSVNEMLEALIRTLPGLTHCKIEIASDLVGAAKALFDNGRGIACILGTGSNSGLYNGAQITMNVPPLGFILGDEGSGARLGCRLVGDILKGLLPCDIIEDFNNRFALSQQDIIRRVYREEAPNRFLASFCPFLSDHISHPAIHTLVEDEFRRFFARNISQYTSAAHNLPIGFIGSVAYHFMPIIETIAAEYGYRECRLLKAPMGALLHHAKLSLTE